MKRMRTTVLAIGVVSIFMLPSAVLAEGLSVGPKIGLNLANISGSDAKLDLSALGGPTYEPKIKIGFAVGGFLSYSFTDLISLQPELLYTMKGAAYDTSPALTFSANYVEIPILANFTFLKGNVRPRVFVGPEVAFLLSASVSDGGTTDIKDELNALDYGLVLGAGADIALGSGKLTVDARYDLGLTTMDKEDGGPASDIKNSVISLTVGYLFSL